MGQFERFIIGVVITISAYRFLYDSQQRHFFHSSFTTLLQCLSCSQCYCCIETVRLAVSGVIFTAGIALAMDACISLGIIVEIGLLTIEALKLRHCSCLNIYQNIFVHMLFIAILVANFKACCSKPVQAKPQVARVQEQRKEPVQQAPVHVEASRHSKKEQVVSQKPKNKKK